MKDVFRAVVYVIVSTFAATSAYAQGGVTTSLSGTVVDASGAVIPGADVVAKNKATTAESRAVTSDSGAFTIPALNPGAYTVTVSLMGFKTAVLNDVVLNAATPASVRVTLEVGKLEETVVVQAASEIMQTQSPSVSVTIDANRIINLPLSSRSAMDFVVNLPGVQTPGDSRSSQINGLPRSAIAITWDGVNVQDNYLKTSDGFFAIISPRLDAIEEVTLTTAAQGADQTGQGAARINFVTRSGSNRFTGSGYHYYRNDSLNANSWSRNRDQIAKANLLQNQPGVRVGGPISIPGLFSGRDKAFFFVNYEEFRQPTEFTATRTILHPRAQEGWFRYNTSGGVQEVNVLDLARANNQVSGIDPVIAKLLADIRASTNGTGTVNPATNPSHESFTFPGAARSFNYYPTVRIDYNLTQKHRLTGTTNYQNYENFPDQTNNQEVRFPGFPSTAGQTSWRRSSAFSVRSTLSKNLVNEARVAFVNYEVDFAAGVDASQFKGTSVADQNGYNLTLGFGLTGATSQASMSARQAPSREFGTTLSWIKGSHSLSFGGSLSHYQLKQWTQQLVPSIGFGIETSEPVNSLFTTANFPNASATNLGDARALYALLTGRVNSIGGSAILNASGEYNYNGLLLNTGSIDEWGLYVQDQWRVGPSLTLNGGLRWELQMPFTPGGDNYATATYADVFGVSGLDASGKPNVFKPGVLNGRPTEFVKYAKGTRAYNVDYTNVAPTIGAAWTPSSESGFARRLLGKTGDSVIRAGYSMAFNRNGMNDYRGIFASNPGSSITATRNNSLGNLDLDSRGLPVLFRDGTRLGAPAFPAKPDYPLTVAKGTAQVTNSVNIFDPDMRTPYTHSWNVGISRSLTRDMAVEVRYVGTRGRADWATVNYNEVNIIDNGFLNEFRLAQANLQAHVAAGCGQTGQPSCSFAYRGPGTGTSPLPIYLAYIAGRTDASNTAAYTTSTLWSSTNFTNPLAANNPNPFSPASSSSTAGLYGTPDRRANAALAGVAANFFVVNPGLLGGANIRTNLLTSHYDSIQIELRRRLSQGLQMQANYAYGNTWLNDFYSIRRPILESLDTGSPGSVTHAFKTDWVYEFPFGRGHRFGANVGGWMDRVIGGWAFAGTARVQSGQVVDLGNVRLVGITEDELRSLYGRYEYPQVFTQNAPMRIYRFPQDIIENTQRASSVSATSATGYGAQGPPTGRYIAPANNRNCIETVEDFGDCGTRVLEITGPPVWFLDLSAIKRVQITGRINAEFRGEFLNAFNHPVMTGGTTGTVTPSGNRVIQLVTRVNW
jgi:carboxypeptidase family protein